MLKDDATQFTEGDYCVYVGYSFKDIYAYEGRVFFKNEYLLTVYSETRDACAEKGFVYAKTLNDEPTNKEIR